MFALMAMQDYSMYTLMEVKNRTPWIITLTLLVANLILLFNIALKVLMTWHTNNIK
jgi:hypothetical protein